MTMGAIELYQALLRAKQNISAPLKNRKAMYGKYADLDAVLQAVEVPLAKEGLFISQSGVVLDSGNVLRTSIIHANTGQSIYSDIPLVTKDDRDPQKMGSSITYARRYGITAILSIVADDDDDANTSAGRNRDGSKPTKQAPTKADKAVTQEQLEEALAIENPLPKKMVEGLINEYQRAGFNRDVDIMAELHAVIDRDFTHIAELTEAEARTAVGHARKVGRGDVARISVID